MIRSWDTVSAVVVLGSVTGIGGSIVRDVIGRDPGHPGKSKLREAYGVKICLRG
jgi:hypothetical protein